MHRICALSLGLSIVLLTSCTKIDRQYEFIDLHDGLPEQVLFTPRASGTFRVSAYTEVTKAAVPNGSSNFVCGYLTWTSKAGIVGPWSIMSRVECPSVYNERIPGTLVFVMHVLRDTPVEIRSSPQSPTSPDFRYDIHLTVERLSFDDPNDGSLFP